MGICLFPSSKNSVNLRVFVFLLLALGAGSGSVCSGQGAAPSSPPPAAPNQSPAPGGKPQTDVKGKSSATTDVNSSDVKTGHAIAERSNLPAVVPAGRPVIGVALEGGGALGLAHVGVLKWMEENRIPIDRLSGTSMGALIGALYASGKTADQLERIASTSAFEKLFYIRAPYNELSYRRREDERDFPQVFTLGLKGGPSFRNALISDGALNDFLNTNLFRYNRTELSFDSFPIPFRCVATDLNTMEPVVFEGGPLPLAVRASISIPGVFSPVQFRDHYLVDGAMMDNLPTDIVREDLHSDVVIGIHLVGSAFRESDVSSLLSVLSRAFSAGAARNERDSIKATDTLIEVDTSAFVANDYEKAGLLIQAGYEAAAKNASLLRRYSLSEADWAQHIADRSSRVLPSPGILRVLKVEGSTPGARAGAAYVFHDLQNRPMAAAEIAESLHRVSGNGTNQASTETFQPPAPNGSALDKIQGVAPDTGLTVRLSPVRRGPPFLQFGLDSTATSSNVSRSTVDFRLLNTDLGGFGSELRTDVRLGFLTQVSTEYYRLLTPSGYFIQPQIGLERQPVYLWRNQQRISEHLQQQAGGGLRLGRTFNRNFQFSFDYQNQVTRWHPVAGEDGTVPVSGDAQTATVHFMYDNTLSGLFSASGTRVEFRAGALFHTVGSENAPLLEFSVRKPIRLTGTQSLFLSADVNSYGRRSVTEPLRFTLGGPLRLSAASVDEYRGTDSWLLRGAYAHRVASMPAGYGQGIYAVAGYEAAEIWAPERRVILRQDGVLTLIGVLPIGTLTLGGSVGDAGHRKLFVSFGRLF